MTSDLSGLAGKMLGTCILEKLLGQGGMGAVYLARQIRPARHVAVKVLMPTSAPASQIYQEFLARFRREADVIARLEHVNIVPIYEYGEQDGRAYLVMPYMTGGSLRDVLTRHGPIALQEVLPYIDQAAAALDYAHAHGVIHRDLKPANFLLHADGRLVLADFGIARILQDSRTPTEAKTLTHASMLLGTPDYMAPEMALGKVVDYRSDIYELGIVVFQMLSGHLPFTGDTPYAVFTQHLQEPVPLLHTTNPNIPPAVDAVIQTATAKQREERYTSAGALATALRNAAMRTTSSSHVQQEDIATAISPLYPTVPPSQHHTPPPQVPSLTPIAEPYKRTPVSYGPSSYPPMPPTDAQTPYPATNPVPDKQQPWWIFMSMLLVLILIIGGASLGLQLGKNATANNPTPTTTNLSITATTATIQTTATPSTASTVTPTKQATPTPVNQPTPIPTTATTTIPVGGQLYTTTSPGHNCDTNGGTWTDYNGVKISCQNNGTTISNVAPSATLQGTFLTQMPGQVYPNNYVIQAKMQRGANSANDFGLYFRNQPGANQQGTYTFLIHADDTWNAYLYDNNTGSQTKLTGDNLGDPHAPVTLTVVANGSQFRFYANGNLLGSINDNTYTSGTVGIAVDQGGSVVVSNFTVYATL